jgi:hypothetical protein
MWRMYTPFLTKNLLLLSVKKLIQSSCDGRQIMGKMRYGAIPFFT